MTDRRTDQEITNGELGRRMDAMTESFKELHTEILEGHQRLRHDYSNVKSVSDTALAKVVSVSERLARTEGQLDKLIWSVIGAYGAILLAVIVAFISNAV